MGKNEYAPTKVFPPGDTIQELMGEYGYSVQGLAQKMGVSLFFVYMLLRGHAALTRNIASKLQDVFGVKAEFWLALEMSYRAYEARQ